MNKEKGNIDFDQIVRERFTNNLMAPPSEMWQEIDNALTSEADSQLDSAIGMRFQENTLSPSFLLRQKILIKSSLLKFANNNYLILKGIGISIAFLITTTFAYYGLGEPKTASKEQKVIQASNKDDIEKKSSDKLNKQIQSTVDSSSKLNKLPSDQNWMNVFNNNTKDNEHANAKRIKQLNETLTKESQYLEKEKQFSLPNNSQEEEETHLDKNLKSNPITNYPSQFDEVITKSDSNTKNHNKANTLSKSALNPELISESLIKGQKNNNVVIIEKADSIKNELNSLVVDTTNSLGNTSESNQKSNNKTIADTLGRTNKSETVEILEKDTLPIDNMEQELKTNKTVLDSAKKISRKDPIFRSENKTSPFSITALLSLVYLDRFLTTDENKDVKDFYDQHQKGEWQFTGELIGNYHINNKWFISFGLSTVNYQQEISLQNLRPEESQTIQMDALNQSITVASSLNEVTMSNLNGFEFGKKLIGRGTPNDLSKDENLYSFNFLEEQEFNFLHIPLSIQYSIGEGKTKFMLSAGLLTSYLIKDKSKIEISNEVNPNYKATIENYHTLRKVSFGLTTRAGITYSFLSSVSFLLTPTFNYSISNLNQSNSNKIKPFDIRISLGLNYHF
tara:strand:- start:6252 stop:8117 length:1866 start_codon:yes stop_codon:yes gene_type:complete